jgi:diacylglycerol kinase family enzyme
MTDKRATIIYNPVSGRQARRADHAREMIRALGERGIAAEARATDGPDAATRLAREAIKDASDIIVSYGGDGTLNEVIQGMAGSRASLAIWPGGTSNVIARDLEIPFNIEHLADLISRGKMNRVSLGLATGDAASRESGAMELEEAEARQYVSADNLSLRLTENAAAVSDPCMRPKAADARALRRYFLMMAGIGLDASIARAVNLKLKRRTGEFAYWVTGINHLFTWRADPFMIEVDGTSYESVFAVVGNGKGYGGGMCITPHAKLDEPLFEVYILPRRANNFAYISALAACMRGKPESTSATLVKGKHIEASSTREPWVEADGEIIGPLPMTFDIIPDALSVIVP